MSGHIVFLASDHRGFTLKNLLAAWLREGGDVVRDFGTETDARCDASDYAEKVAQALRAEPSAKGILICGTGQMMAITANRFSHVRAALCLNPEMARLAREHNDANILALASDLMDLPLAKDCVDVFLTATFQGGRYADRIRKLSAMGGL